MTSNSKIGPSRPITDLTEEDISTHRVWVWALDEETDEDQDETWVYPVGTPELPLGLEYDFIVRATITFANGQTIPGLVEVHCPGDDGMYFSSVAFFWRGKYYGYDDADDQAELLKKTGLREDQVFPYKWKLDVKLKGEPDYRQVDLL